MLVPIEDFSVLFLFDDAKVMLFMLRGNTFMPFLSKNGVIFDTNQAFVCAHKHFSTSFVSSTNS